MQSSSLEVDANLVVGLAYLEAIISGRLAVHMGKSEEVSVKAPTLVNNARPLFRFLNHYQPGFEEYTLLWLALAPHLQTDFFDNILKKHFPDGSHFPAFGGVRGKNHRGILPTGETVQFVLAGNDLAQRLAVQQLFRTDHWFAREGILRLEELPAGEPKMSGRLLLDEEWLERLTTGQVALPRFSPHFPAELLQTELDWTDLVLPANTLAQVQELQIWMEHHPTIQAKWDLQRHLKPGYRVLFHGPPGTGKTLTATLLGKTTNQPVFRVDLSMIVSKYIGETEKNLAQLFDKAAHKNWILFFDEADALFGKRTEVKDARDKFANQESAFLLQKVESHPGLVILASNFKKNMDDAFARRFQSMVYFPFPDAEHRLKLWQQILPKQTPLAKDVDLKQVAAQYELTGSNIVNIVQYCSLQLLAKKKKRLPLSLLLAGVKREYRKEDKRI
jgi:hypothetical protein